jgi:hypothetical protein
MRGFQARACEATKTASEGVGLAGHERGVRPPLQASYRLWSCACCWRGIQTWVVRRQQSVQFKGRANRRGARDAGRDSRGRGRVENLTLREETADEPIDEFKQHPARQQSCRVWERGAAEAARLLQPLAHWRRVRGRDGGVDQLTGSSLVTALVLAIDALSNGRGRRVASGRAVLDEHLP